MMHRNLDRRVEALVRLTDPSHLDYIASLFDLAMSEKTSSWWLDANGTWTRHSATVLGEPLQDMQNVLANTISLRRRSGSSR